MITSPQEYKSLLHYIIDTNEFAPLLRIPESEPVYNIDLNKREIETPNFLSVLNDHDSEVIWFKVDRFYDDIDLYNGNCWIVYKNANNESYFYQAPLKINLDEYGNDKILIPWPISKEVAKKEGIVSFSFRFFKLAEDGLKYVYSLNTKEAKSKILNGLEVTDAIAGPQEWFAEEIESLYEQLRILKNAYT